MQLAANHWHANIPPLTWPFQQLLDAPAGRRILFFGLSISELGGFGLPSERQLSFSLANPFPPPVATFRD